MDTSQFPPTPPQQSASQATPPAAPPAAAQVDPQVQRAVQDAQQERQAAQQAREEAQEAQQAAQAAQEHAQAILDAAEQHQAQQTPPAAAPISPSTSTAGSIRAQFADWPQPGDTRPQPWDLDAAGVPEEDRKLAPGARDTASPVVIRHSYPIVSLGSQGSVVSDLAGRLHLLGYESDITRGENKFSSLTESVMGAVDKFREDYNVQEDPTPFGGNTAKARERAAAIVGPYTWEAILRASERELATL